MTDTKRFTVTHQPGKDAYGLPRKGYRYRVPMQAHNQVVGMLAAQDCGPGLLDEIEIGETLEYTGTTREFVVERTA
jgi:hypothetical protein